MRPRGPLFHSREWRPVRREASRRESWRPCGPARRVARRVSTFVFTCPFLLLGQRLECGCRLPPRPTYAGPEGGLVGKVVQIFGTKREDLNGQEGFAESYDARIKRYSVKTSRLFDPRLRSQSVSLSTQVRARFGRKRNARALWSKEKVICLALHRDQ